MYSVIDELLVNNRRETDTCSLEGVREKMSSMMTPPLPKPRVKKTPLSKQDSGLYARLDETCAQGSSNFDIPMEVIKDTCSDCRRPPTPPPRRHRNISTVTKGSDCDEALGNGKRLNIPGVSESYTKKKCLHNFTTHCYLFYCPCENKGPRECS